MEPKQDDLTIRDVLELHANKMLFANPEYQRGAVWNKTQKKKLVDSVLRKYPIPLMYFHRIRQAAGKLVSERFEIIDGQQRINALAEFHEGAFKLLDPLKDESEARYPDFIKKQPCPWAGKLFSDLSKDLQETFLGTTLRTVQITTDNQHEARDLFVRLQAGMPLNSQEKRDAWPGQFTDYVLRLGGKPNVARYPGNDFFNSLMGAKRLQDRGKFRQLAAQVAMLYFTRRGPGIFCDINSQALDDFYYEHLDFDAGSVDAVRLSEIFDKLTSLFRDQKRSKILGHESIHLVLLVDSLMDDYTRSWEKNFATAFDEFREKYTEAKRTKDDEIPNEYWLRYGVSTRVNSDRADVIQRRHEFFSGKMRETLKPQMKDSDRAFGALERELIYYRDRKKCQVPKCGADVTWPDAEIHHVEEHAKGGPTVMENGVLVHRGCHPKGAAAEKFAKHWASRTA
jgi:hypothetical protein